MAALLNRILRRRDQCTVSYSRFGVPGDVADDRPPPTSIVIEAFDDNDPDFIFMRICHAQKAAVASAGLGMSFVILLFISTFLEFDWDLYRKDLDALAIVFLFLFLLFGLIVHYDVIVGVKKQSPKHLIPFIVVYSLLIGSETVFAM
ncbi:unnamed protein product [Dracunculus medinensis]|uniref:Protein YIPF6 n=1 Tax=Dracunculus medinensis TaxID=318479 RepID=A0A0N4U737_DRAME|nr:unnamed protein product [Dracunculus medinensis]